MANTTDTKKILKIIFFSVFLLFIIIYAFFVSRNIIFGVKIKNINIKDGATFESNILEIKGNAKNAINLTINDRPISIDQKGDFSETIILSLGYNVVNIKAKDKFGNSDEKNFRLMGKFNKETKVE